MLPVVIPPQFHDYDIILSPLAKRLQHVVGCAKTAENLLNLTAPEPVNPGPTGVSNRGLTAFYTGVSQGSVAPQSEVASAAVI